jgi:hypothetical protein
MLRIFERERLIYVPVNGNGVWRPRYNSELYTFYDKPDIVKVVTMERLRWLGHLFRMQELDPCRKLTFLNQKALDVQEDLS